MDHKIDSMIGQSTGFQNFLNYCSDEPLLDQMKLVKLQAPASDREGPMTGPNDDLNLRTATNMVEAGDGEETILRIPFGHQ